MKAPSTGVEYEANDLTAGALAGAVVLTLRRFEPSSRKPLRELFMETTPDQARHISRLLARMADKADAIAASCLHKAV